jgi:hypothetical protein
MGRGMKFDPRRRRGHSWRRPPRGGGRRVSLGRWLARLRPFGMLAALVWLWGTNTGMVEPIGLVATARLQALLNEGPFEMVGSRADMTDRYGRELRSLMRGRRSIGAQLVEEGVVRRYLGYKMGWC